MKKAGRMEGVTHWIKMEYLMLSTKRVAKQP